MAVQIILKSSSVEDKRPQPSQLSFNEISLNYNEAGPFICCKDSSGRIIQLGGIKFSPNVPADALPGTWWLNTATKTFFVWDGLIWHQVGGQSGGGGTGITQILGDDGIDAFVNGSVVTLNVDANQDKGLHFLADRLAINAGANLSFDSEGKLQADVASISYKGTIDLTSDPVVSNPSPNDAYINVAAGAMSAAWRTATGEGATTVTAGDTVIYTTSGWSYVPVQPVTLLWNRNGTTLRPQNDGDDVVVTAANGTETISLNSNGSAEYAGSVSIDGSGTFLDKVKANKLVVATQNDTDDQVAAAFYGATGSSNRGLQIKLSSGGTTTPNSLVIFDAIQASTGALGFATKGVERMRLSGSTLQIGGTFPTQPLIRMRGADGSADFSGAVSIGGTTDSNTIDSYEEGTWTPVFTVGGVVDPAFTAGTCKYVKVGDAITCYISMTVDGSSTTGNTVFITLPFSNNAFGSLSLTNIAGVTLNSFKGYTSGGTMRCGVPSDLGSNTNGYRGTFTYIGN